MIAFLQKNSMLWVTSLILIIGGVVFLSYIQSTSEREILPLLIESRNHPKPQRTPGTFAEEEGPNASFGKLTFIGDSEFSFTYEKSKKQTHPFSGVWFPLENLDIDFSDYDVIEINVKPDLARRIPFNLSVQTKKETHQYIRNFIEIVPNRSTYTLQLEDFVTPTTWYQRNDLSQVEIPQPDLSKVEALSFESCQLLGTGIADEFVITKLTLKKDVFWVYALTISIIMVSIALLKALVFGEPKEEAKTIHVPIKATEYEPTESSLDKIIIFMSQNYTSPNLTVSDVAKEFGKSNNELSKIIKEHTEMSFPQYLNYLRIEEAKRLLRSKQYKTISEIGYTVGFNSPSNFIRVFKNSEGTSPKSFSEG